LKPIDLKTFVTGATLALFAVLGTVVAASAQQNDDRERGDQKRHEKMQKEQAKAERQREAEWARRNNFRTRTGGSGYYTVNMSTDIAEGRYRVNRNGIWYNTDNRGVDLLRQAVNDGYREGFAAGRTDRNMRRRGNWTNNLTYRNGTYGYQNGVVDRSQYQYYFRQGFQRGYQDGSNSRYQDGYTGDYQYGRTDGGSLNMLGPILNQILNIQNY
jgi:hypothetical protein